MSKLVLQKLILLFCVLLLAPLSARAQEPQPPPEDPVSWGLQASQSTVKAGGKFTVQVTARIDKDWHLYSLEQEEGGPIPTRIKLPTGQPFELAGDIGSPTPRVKFDKNFGINTEYYEGEVVFTLPIKVAAHAPGGAQKLSVQVRYQSCNDSLCLPPKLVTIEVDLRISAE